MLPAKCAEANARRMQIISNIREAIILLPDIKNNGKMTAKKTKETEIQSAAGHEKRMLRTEEDCGYPYKTCREKLISIAENRGDDSGKAEGLIMKELQKFKKSEFPDGINMGSCEVHMGFYGIHGFKKISLHIGNSSWYAELETEYCIITRYTMIL